MEGLSLASSVATLIGVTMQVFEACGGFLRSIKGGYSASIRLILVESAGLKATLEALNVIIHASPADEVKSLEARISAAIKECFNIVKKLHGLVPKPLLDKESGQTLTLKEKSKVALGALEWALWKESNYEELLSELRVHKETINLGLVTGLTENLQNVVSVVNNTNVGMSKVASSLDAAQRPKICQWLEKVNPSPSHNSARELHEKGTGHWLLDSGAWKNWLNGTARSRLLWIHGIPGAGKTVLASTMAEHIHELIRRDTKRRMAYYYCHHSRNADETAPFLGWILSQLCRSSQLVPKELQDLYDSGCDPNTTQLLELLGSALNHFTVAYVVIDAVDESSKPMNLASVLAILASDKRFSNLRVAVTSREHQDVKTALESHAVAVSMDNRDHRSDIGTFMASKLQEHQYRNWDNGLRQEVTKKLLAKANGMFRYAACQLEVLAGCGSPAEVIAELEQLPQSLEETYEQILQKIEKKHRDRVVRALGLIIGSSLFSVPIHAKNLVRGVYGAEPGQGNFYSIDMLKRQCPGLILVLPTNEVVLAHYSVQEYLMSPRLKNNTKVSWCAVDTTRAAQIYYDIILSTVQRFHGNPANHDRTMDSNGLPLDFELYSLCEARDLMRFEKATIEAHETIQNLVLELLDPYSKSFAGLRRIGEMKFLCASNSVVEFACQFHPTDNQLQRQAAHLTMIVSLMIPNMVKKFLSGKTEEQIKALFSTKMHVSFPTSYREYQSSHTMDETPFYVNLLDFYLVGKMRYFTTDLVIIFLHKHFAKYLPVSPPAGGHGAISSRGRDPQTRSGSPASVAGDSALRLNTGISSSGAISSPTGRRPYPPASNPSTPRAQSPATPISPAAGRYASRVQPNPAPPSRGESHQRQHASGRSASSAASSPAGASSAPSSNQHRSGANVPRSVGATGGDRGPKRGG
ncbi:hypothetical protein VTK26DRAFT_1378 [Humicola hyalothermophila]